MKSIRHQAAGELPPRDVSVMTSTAEEELRRSYPAEPKAVTRVRDDFGALAGRHGATHEQVDDIRLMVSEAVTNAVRHAYADGPGTVEAIAAVGGGRITILVADDGNGPRAQSRDPGAGWGWPLMAALSERLTIRHRSTGGTEVEMLVRIGSERPPASQPRRGSDSSASIPAAPRSG